MLQAQVSHEISSLGLPTLFSNSVRKQIYQRAQSQTYTPGQQIQIHFPPLAPDELTDFRDSYIQFDVELTNDTASVDEVIQFRTINQAGPAATVTPTSGTYFISYDGFTSDAIAFNAAVADVKTAIEELPSVYRDFLHNQDTPAGIITVDSNFGTAGQLQITISSDNFIPSRENKMFVVENHDLSDGVDLCGIEFDLDTQGQVAFPRLEWNAASVIERVEVRLNSRNIFECNNYNILHTMYEMTNDPEYTITTGKLLTNTGSKYFRYWPNSRRFSIRLHGVGPLETVLPLGMLTNSQLRLDINLANAGICLVDATNVSTGSYSISNVEFHYHSLRLSPPEMNHIAEMLDGEGITVPFINYSNFSDNISGSNEDEIINFSYKHFLGLSFVMRQRDYVDDRSNERKLSTFLKNHISNFRLKIGNQYYPQDQIDLLQNGDLDFDVGQAYHEFLRFFGCGHGTRRYGHSPTIAGLAYELDETTQVFYDWTGRGNSFNATFIGAITTDPHQRETYHSHLDSSSGVNTEGQTNTILELRNLELASENEIDIFGRYQAFLHMSRLGNRGMNFEFVR